MIVVGILLEIAAAALGTTSKQLIAYSEHVKKRWIFHIGASINIAVGPVVDASAYAFAPQVVIAPFACLDVIFNAVTAPYTLHWQNERFTKAHLIGTGLVALGAIFTSVFGGVPNRVLTVEELEEQLLKRQSLSYMATELLLIVVINLCLKAKLLDATTRGICLGVIAGILMGNVFFLKGVVNIVHDTVANQDFSAWLRPTPYICAAGAAGGAVLGHIFMRKGLGEYKGIFMVTIFEGAHITAACLSGFVVMEEMKHAPWWRYSLYWASLLTLVLGMVVINTAAKDSTLPEKKKFHIAQSFVNDPEVSSSQIGRPCMAENYPQPGAGDKGSQAECPPAIKQEAEFGGSNMLEAGTVAYSISKSGKVKEADFTAANLLETGTVAYSISKNGKVKARQMDPLRRIH